MGWSHSTRSWTDDRLNLLKQFWLEGLSASEIAKQLGGGLTKAAVIGKVNRLGINRSARAIPSQPARLVPANKTSREPRPQRAYAALNAAQSASSSIASQLLPTNALPVLTTEQLSPAPEIIRLLPMDEVYALAGADIAKESARQGIRSSTPQKTAETPKSELPIRQLQLRNGIDERYFGISLENCLGMTGNFRLLVCNAEIESLGELIEILNEKGMSLASAITTGLQISRGDVLTDARSPWKNVAWAENVLKNITRTHDRFSRSDTLKLTDYHLR